MIFPEGKLSEDGKLQPILPGVLLIAQQAKVPIVPTALINTDKLMPYGKTTPRFIKEPVDRPLWPARHGRGTERRRQGQ